MIHPRDYQLDRNLEPAIGKNLLARVKRSSIHLKRPLIHQGRRLKRFRSDGIPLSTVPSTSSFIIHWKRRILERIYFDCNKHLA